MNVVALAPKIGMRHHPDLDQRVARRATVEAGPALPLEPQHLPLAHAGGNGHVEALVRCKREALAGAIHSVKEIDGKDVMMIRAAHADRAAARPPARKDAEEIVE